ncbi:MAG: endolytic transglycosylase MltG [Clostridiales bacterium]|nr:endolytic transglycosylase MltG [Clostridiales bacterium]
MNLKYYLRGLGLGIIITALIMGFAGGKKETLTNEEIIARAKTLGMVENKVLTEYTEEMNNEGASKNEGEADQTANTEKMKPEEQPANTEDIKPEANSENTDEEVIDDMSVESDVEVSEPAVFSVKRGESTRSIAKRLEEIGLITSAEDFNTYLLKKGYDRKIVAAEYEIPSDADENAIARILTGEKVEKTEP